MRANRFFCTCFLLSFGGMAAVFAQGKRVKEPGAFNPFSYKSMMKFELPEYKSFIYTDIGVMWLVGRNIQVKTSIEGGGPTTTTSPSVSDFSSGYGLVRLGYGYYFRKGLFLAATVGSNYSFTEGQRVQLYIEPQQSGVPSPSNAWEEEEINYNLIPLMAVAGWNMPIKGAFMLTPKVSAGYAFAADNFKIRRLSSGGDTQWEFSYSGGFTFEAGLGLSLYSERLSLEIQPKYGLTLMTFRYPGQENYNATPLYRNIVSSTNVASFTSHYFGISVSIRPVL